MTTSNILEILANDFSEVPHGLVIIAGPKNSYATDTTLFLESALSQKNPGTYFRVGQEAPDDTSSVKFIPAFHSEMAADSTDEEVIEEFAKWQAWESNMCQNIYSPNPNGVFIHDLHEIARGFSTHVINMSILGILTVVSVEANTAEDAVRYISQSANVPCGIDSTLASVLHRVIVQTPTVDVATGETLINVEDVMLDADFFNSL